MIQVDESDNNTRAGESKAIVSTQVLFYRFTLTRSCVIIAFVKIITFLSTNNPSARSSGIA